VGVTEVLKYILALIILVVIFAGYSAWRFNLKAKSDIEALFLEANTNGRVIRVITEDMLRDLPAPVQRWLIHCGVVGKEEIQTVYLMFSVK
jgi:hypothetical protein